MLGSQRLAGLELLRLAGAPTPEYHIVATRRDIDCLARTSPRYGWTIRTCRTDNVREMGLFYRNYVPPAMAPAILLERLEKKDRVVFLVYPSWEMVFSCNVVFLDTDVMIEGNYGSQKSVTMGRSVPDFTIKVPFGLRSKLLVLGGKVNLDVSRYLGRIIYWCRKTCVAELYAEMAVTTSGALLFYELFDLANSSGWGYSPKKRVVD